ncbi:hypothetical protein PybrP1_006687 [[Pythium] brassicae (nom. inval.)]|nr:hypothetical protein PybrP1_006687 [[Pythium] brassicae (nom. inval.)]
MAANTATAAATGGSVQRISRDEFDRQALEFTTEQVQQLNVAVRLEPAIGARSAFFQSEENVRAGLPVFQGTHTRFVYDDDEEEIVAAVDVTQEALHNNPLMRTVEDLESEDEEDGGDDADAREEDDAVANTFYQHADGGNDESGDDEDELMAAAGEESAVAALLEDVAMELAAVALDEQQLRDAAK